jgi:hypothetical protein
LAVRASSPEALVEAFNHLMAIDELAALRLEPAAFDLLAPFEANLVVLLQEPKPFADDLAGVVVQPALDFPANELLEFWRQRYVHGDLCFLPGQDSKNNRL